MLAQYPHSQHLIQAVRWPRVVKGTQTGPQALDLFALPKKR